MTCTAYPLSARIVVVVVVVVVVAGRITGVGLPCLQTGVTVGVEEGTTESSIEGLCQRRGANACLAA